MTPLRLAPDAAAPAAAPVLAVDRLELRAGGQAAQRALVRHLGFEVRRHERWVVLGPNGAGKSTLLSALAGLLPVHGGCIRWLGRAAGEWPPTSLAGIRAWCPQFWVDPFPCRVDETVRLARLRMAWAEHDADAREDDALHHLLERLDIAHLGGHDVRTLSGGERQRVAIAAALWQAAPVLLLDEPASHLDLSHQQLLVRRLREHADAGGSVVCSLHDLNLAWALATHAVLLDGRAAALAGTREAVMTPASLRDAFGVAVERVEVCGEQRFWIGAAA
jgi:iron complex transport system ATP-binding protein